VSYDTKRANPTATRGGERIRHARLYSAIRRLQGSFKAHGHWEIAGISTLFGGQDKLGLHSQTGKHPRQTALARAERSGVSRLMPGGSTMKAATRPQQGEFNIEEARAEAQAANERRRHDSMLEKEAMRSVLMSGNITTLKKVVNAIGSKNQPRRNR